MKAREEIGKVERKDIANYAKEQFASGATVADVRLSIKNEFDTVPNSGRLSEWKDAAMKKIVEVRAQIGDLEESLEEKELEYDTKGLFVYTSSVKKDGTKVKERHQIDWEFVNNIVRDYVSKGSNMSAQQIIDKYKIKDKVFNALKSALNLNKHSGIANETYLRVLEDNVGEVAVDEYIESAAFTNEVDKFKTKELSAIEKAKQKLYESVVKNKFKLEHHLKELSEFVREYKPQEKLLEPLTPKNQEVLIMPCGDMHVGKNGKQITRSLQSMFTKIVNSGAGKVVILNVGDNLETVLLGGMHASQTAELEIKGFEQILEAVRIWENFIISLHERGIVVEFHGITGNHCFLKEENPMFLTDQGYKSFDDIVENKYNIAQLDSEGNIEYVQPTKVIDELHIGTFYKYKRNNSEFTVTSKHKFIIDGDKVNAEDLQEFSTINTPNVGGNYTFDRYDELALLCIFDGCVVEYDSSDHYKKSSQGKSTEGMKKKYRLQFKISKPEKISYICGKLDELGFKYSIKECKKSGGNILQPYYIRLYSEDAVTIFNLIGTKKKVPQRRYSADKGTKEKILDIIKNTDGTEGQGHIRMYNTDDSINQLIWTLFDCGISENKGRGYGGQRKKKIYETRIIRAGHRDSYKATSFIGQHQVCDFEMPGGNLIVMVGGNAMVHSNCRGTKNPDEDVERIPGLAMYEILKSRLVGIESQINYYKEYIACVEVGMFNFIMMHGDFIKGKKPEQIIHHHGIPHKTNIIVYGHLHNPEIVNDINTYLIRVPAINNGGWYEKNVVMRDSAPGYVTVVMDEMNNPQITFHNTR